jgi:hypothetical protein
LSNGVNPVRPDQIRPYRPFGRIFHANHEIYGLATDGRRCQRMVSNGVTPAENSPRPDYQPLIRVYQWPNFASGRPLVCPRSPRRPVSGLRSQTSALRLSLRPLVS